MKKIILYFMVFVMSFYLVGSISGNFYQEEILADYEEYVFSFDEKTIIGNKIVAFDNRGLEHIQYYVLEFTGEKYIGYTYYFVGNHEEYMAKYEEVSSKIVDYNYEQYMIKTLDYIGDGTYYDIMNDLEEVIEEDVLYIIY